ncbi:hypothetical protein F751_2425 [Auxenochlorella protothecoides]|uniref:Uncharacterized protein n=1 Tax=Auxenochlorella protothecoides TaxID=3075 RepID=A0A087SG53_AUXPR|nr:hypothetical protein F751_2425 [Auxenochlorella protothecoides]KFM24707.1 hypothetical protein F751_2425 [Auxenochlorella protothecoides]
MRVPYQAAESGRSPPWATIPPSQCTNSYNPSVASAWLHGNAHLCGGWVEVPGAPHEGHGGAGRPPGSAGSWLCGS